MHSFMLLFSFQEKTETDHLTRHPVRSTVRLCQMTSLQPVHDTALNEFGKIIHSIKIAFKTRIDCGSGYADLSHLISKKITPGFILFHSYSIL